METTITTIPTIPTELPAAITGKFNIALTNSKFQDIANKASKLVFNEDNIDNLKAFFAEARKVEIAIEQTHKSGKEESLKISRNWDAAKNAFLSQVAAITSNPKEKYDALCRDILKRQKEEKEEHDRIEAIKNGIDNNAVAFSKQISECTTSKQLTDIERTINLEKSRKEKYQEFLPQAIEKYNALNSILKTQKEKVKELEQIEEDKKKAESEGNDEKIMELMDRQEVVESKIEETKIQVQEVAIEQPERNAVAYARTIFPKVTAKRTTWKWEMVSGSEMQKKMPDWAIVTPNKEKIDAYLFAKKAEGLTVDEFITAGVRFFIDKTF